MPIPIETWPLFLWRVDPHLQAIILIGTQYIAFQYSILLEMNIHGNRILGGVIEGKLIPYY